ncbi:iron-containing redox enzyme family protein [Archangium gephyra]|uniref:iron-containing redox enzyme family protein n=1 Tax=Archangium gephyra TaxID=48 RepID=UPI0035D5160A
MMLPAENLSIENIEDALRLEFRTQVVEPGIKSPAKFLQRWSYLSSQVPRLHGAALARIKIPDIQLLLAEIAYGECGSGNRDKIHSKLLNELIRQSPQADVMGGSVDPELARLFEEAVTALCQMNQDEAIGFIVGLEAPAYDILGLLKRSLIGVDIPADTVLRSEYIVIHEEVEKMHQESGHAAMGIILDAGCDLRKIYEGGDYAIQFLIDMVGERRFLGAA